MFNKPGKAFGLILSSTGVRLTALAGLLFGAGLCLMNSQQVQSQAAFVSQFRPDQIIVQLKPGSLIDSVNERYETKTIKHLAGTNFYLLSTADGKDEATSVGELGADAAVQEASLNRVVQSPFTSLSRSIMSFPDGYAIPNQPQSEFHRNNQALDTKLSLSAAHERSRGAGITVAVIDTGIDLTHPTLAGHLWVDERDHGEIPGDEIDDDGDGLVDDAYGWDFVDDDNEPTERPDNPETTVAGHGTFIAGVIAVVAPECRIMPIRAFTPAGESDEFTVAEGLKWATDHGADVICMSFGTPDDSDILSGAIEYAYQQEAILVAAVGNEATDTPPLYPANYQYVMGVTAVDANDKLAFFSNFGPRVSMSAPGKSIISTYPGGGYALWSGTSFAAPLVAAEAALVISIDGDRRFTRRVLESTALNIDSLNVLYTGLIGRGRVRPLNALMALNMNLTLNPMLDLHSRVELTSDDTTPCAKGSAEVAVIGAEQELRINAYCLTPGSEYSLVINDQQIPGSFTASAFGKIEVLLSSNPGVKALPLPAALQPVTRVDRVELRDEGDGLVLGGEFEPVTDAAAPNQTILKEARLYFLPPSTVAKTPSPQLILPIPSGVARVEVDSGDQVLTIALETPATNSTYTVRLDGVSIGTVTSQLGSVSVSFSSNALNNGLVPAFMPLLCNVSVITIVDSLGRVVAQGEFRIAGGNVGSGDAFQE